MTDSAPTMDAADLTPSKRRPAGQTGVFKLLQTTLYFDLHRSNPCCLLHNISSEDPEQIAVFNSPVLQQYPKNGCGLNLVAAAASRARAREHAGICNWPAGRPDLKLAVF